MTWITWEVVVVPGAADICGPIPRATSTSAAARLAGFFRSASDFSTDGLAYGVRRRSWSEDWVARSLRLCRAGSSRDFGLPRPGS